MMDALNKSVCHLFVVVEYLDFCQISIGDNPAARHQLIVNF